MPDTPLGTLTLIGAGELMPAMGKVHREALSQVQGPVRAVFVDTTAGFETNAEAITAKAVEYYRHRLQTELRVASFRHSKHAAMSEVARAVAEVRAANFIFAGPGSPTYALHHWRGSPVWDAIVERFQQGAHLLFASAASITLGRYAVPVYEVYKAGRDPYWEEGLDLLSSMGLNVAIVPHFNDNSGGEMYDSRFCYMGSVRFDILQELLPPDVAIMGIDEYTAVRFSPTGRMATVSGQGGVTIIANGARTFHPAGQTFSFDDLHSSQRVVVPTGTEEPRTYGYGYADAGEAGGPLEDLIDYVGSLGSLSQAERLELLTRIEALQSERAAAPDTSQADVLVELVVELRAALRQLKQWGLADRARDRLLELGYEIQDTPQGTTWKRG